MSETSRSSIAPPPVPPVEERHDVLIIAPAEQAQTVTRALQEARLATIQKPGVVEDHLMALGHAAQTRPTVVIASVASLDGEAPATGAALRRILPNATLLLVGPAQQQERYHAALSAGFDRYLSEPLDGGTLRHAIRAVAEHRNGAASYAAELAAAARHSSAPPLPARSGGPLGDVDLVDQLMRDPAHLPQMAVQLIREQSNITGVEWARSLEHIPQGHVRATVGMAGRTFGYLHAPEANEDELARWADWMSHWVALQQHMVDLWHMALRDELTGVWNRRYFHRFLTNILERAARERFRVTVLVFDIDDFKLYNDRYGHAAGDEILRETARLMQSVVRDHDVVARIGGDEFAVIFWDAEAPRQPNSEHPANVRMMTERFQRAICQHKFPKLLEEARDTLTISAGLAGFPWDGRTPEELLAKADEMAMQSKRQGKDAVTFGPGALETCGPD